MATGNPCVDRLVAAGKITEAEAKELISNLSRLASLRAQRDNGNTSKALQELVEELVEGETLLSKIQERNALLNIKAKNSLKSFVSRFRTAGEGLRAFFEGTPRNVQGGRLSIDAQAKALHQQYFGALVDGLEQNGVLQDFRSGKLNREIFQEMGELGRLDGNPGISGNEAARKIAAVLDGVTDKMVSRQNRAGAYITRLPGYITRQTHDQTAIRYAGHTQGQPLSKEQSLRAWSEFVLPLLDHEKTFHGLTPDQFLRDVHEGLYTGVHGAPTRAEMSYGSVYPNTAKKISASRLLHFKDADAAYRYNEEFGVRNLQDAVFSDLFYRSRNIAVMENLGPNPEATFRQTIRELGEELRMQDDAGTQVDSLKDWRVEASFREALGLNDIPSNPSLHRRASALRLMVQMAKMGAVTISSLTDKAFFQSEMAFQGVSYLQTLGKQFTALFPSNDKKKSQYLRLLGVGLDGLIGNTIARFSMHDTTVGVMHRMQRKFFDLNFLNWWTDNHKMAAADLMVSHLGENAGHTFDNLPKDLQNVLSMYDIRANDWNALRSLVERDENGNMFIWPEKASSLNETLLRPILEERGTPVTPRSLQTVAQELETKLRSYIIDRVDYAVPTPGAQQKKWMSMNTQAGTPLGEAMRALMLFKSFPTTILTKILARDVYSRGSQSMKQFLLSDHKGKFWIAHTIAMGTVMGYMSGMIRDALKGKTPKQLIDDEGKINMATVNDAALRGGSLGILGDVLAQEYDRGYRGFMSTMSGPIFGQTDQLAAIASQGLRGEDVSLESGKFFQDNIPYINLFYIRPVLDYFILWHLQEALKPGSLKRTEESVKEKFGQDYFVKPSEIVK